MTQCLLNVASVALILGKFVYPLFSEYSIVYTSIRSSLAIGFLNQTKNRETSVKNWDCTLLVIDCQFLLICISTYVNKCT